MSAVVTMFTQPGCGWCITAKKWMEQQGIPYEEMDTSRMSDGLRSTWARKMMPLGVSLISKPAFLAVDERSAASGFSPATQTWLLGLVGR